MLNYANQENEISAISHVSFLLAMVLIDQLSRHVLVDQKGFAGVFDLRDGTFEVEGL